MNKKTNYNKNRRKKARHVLSVRLVTMTNVLVYNKKPVSKYLVEEKHFLLIGLSNSKMNSPLLNTPTFSKLMFNNIP